MNRRDAANPGVRAGLLGRGAAQAPGAAWTERVGAWALRHPLWVLLAAGLAVRALPATVNFVIGTDEGLFLTLAQRIAAGLPYTANGRVIQSDFPPGFPLFAAAIYRLGGGLELPSKLNLLLVGSLLPLPVYWLARGLAEPRPERGDLGPSGAALNFTPLLAGVLTALLPALALATSNFEATAEPLYSLLLYTGWAALWRGLATDLPGLRRPARSWLLFLLAGLALGAAHLVRWEGMILGLLGAAAIIAAKFGPLLLGDRRRPRHPERSAPLAADGGHLARFPKSPKTSEVSNDGDGGLLSVIPPLTLFLAGLAAFAVPYALFLKQHTGAYVNPKTTITQLHSALLEASTTDPYAFEKYYYDLEDVLADPQGLSRVPPELLAYRTPLLQRYARNILLEARLWLTTASLMTLVWIVPAIACALALPRWRSVFLLLLFAPLGAIPASVVDPRYFLPALPAAMILAAFGWEWLDRRFGGRVLAPGLRWGTALSAAALALFLAFDLAAPFLLQRPTEYRRAGLALRGALPDGARMLARKRQAPFYAGAIWEWLPFADAAGVAEYARAHGADYVLLDRRTVVPLRPQLVDLLDPANAPGWLRPIYYDEAGGVVVYFVER
jgi:hypothetical protein